MSGINLDFKSFNPIYDFAPGVEAAVAEAHEPYAIAYLTYLGAKPFGNAVVHQKQDADGNTNSEKVEAFSVNQYLYVCRSSNGLTMVFQYCSPSGLLLTEAFNIVQEHCQKSTLDLI